MSQDRDDDVDVNGVRDSDAAAAVPTGKAGRGDTAVAGRVRTDADKPEDTRTARTNPFQYIGQVVEELRKVIWPSRRNLVTYTLVVLVFVSFMVALVALLDFLVGQGVNALFGA